MTQKAKVLMAEDQVTIAMQMQNSLMANGYDVVAVYSTGEELLERLEEDTIDMLVVNTSLGGELDGVETAMRVRERSDVPIIFLGPSSLRSDLTVSESMEPCTYLHTPFDSNELLTSVELLSYKKEKGSRLKKARDDLSEIHEELRAIDNMSFEVIDTVSHELRTSITVASIAIELAMREVDNISRANHLSMAEKALVRQSMIVENLLATANISRKKEISINYEIFNIKKAALEAKCKMESVARSKQIIINTELENLNLRGDFHKVKHVLINLLENAIKMSDPGGSILMSIHKKDGSILINVGGFELDPDYEDRMRIKEMADNHFLKESCLMGLPVAKKIIEAHKGEIGIESANENSFRYFVRLPEFMDENCL